MRINLLVVCSILLGASLVSVGCSDQKTQNKRLDIVVNTITMKPQQAYRWVDTFGLTEGVNQVEVRSQVSGILRQLNFTEGESVKVGQALFEIEKEPYLAALNEAQALTNQSITNLNKAQRDVKRAQALIKANAISRQDYDNAISELEKAQSALDVAKAKQKKAEIDLSHATVPAPVDGIAGKSEVNIGSLVSDSTTLLTTITQPSDLRVSFAIGDRDLVNASFSRNSRVLVFSPDGKPPIEAKLDFISQQVDSQRGTLRMRAKLPEGTHLWPGQYVEIRVMAGIIEEAYVVPQGVVRQKPDGTYAVYVYENGLAREREVSVSHWEGENWILTAGLKQGDQVISNQILRLRDKTPVKLQHHVHDEIKEKTSTSKKSEVSS